MGVCYARPRAAEERVPDSLDLPHLDAPVMRRMSTAKRASATPVTWIENSTFVAQEDTVFPMRPESLLLFDSGAADGSEAPKPLPQANEHVVADHIAAFLSTVASPQSTNSIQTASVPSETGLSDVTRVFLDDLHELMADSGVMEGKGGYVELGDGSAVGESSADDDIDSWLATLSLDTSTTGTHVLEPAITSDRHSTGPYNECQQPIDEDGKLSQAVEQKGQLTEGAAASTDGMATEQGSADVARPVRPVSLYGFFIEDE